MYLLVKYPFAPSVSFSNPPSRDPSHSRSPLRTLDDCLWQLRFPVTELPAISQRLQPEVMWSRLAQLNATNPAFPLHVDRVWWSRPDAIQPCIMLQFAPHCKVENISTREADIKFTLAHGVETHKISLERWTPLARVFFRDLPHRDPRTKKLYTVEDIKLQLAAYVDLANLEHTFPPKWTPLVTGQDLSSPDITRAVLMITFRDTPDRAVLDPVLAGRYYLFGASAVPKEGKRVAHLTQCTRCWILGRVHTNCQIVCAVCGSKSHIEENHISNCRGCVAVRNEDLDSCSHRKCVNCSENHTAWSNACVPRRPLVSGKGKKPESQPPLPYQPGPPEGSGPN